MKEELFSKVPNFSIGKKNVAKIYESNPQNRVPKCYSLDDGIAHSILGKSFSLRHTSDPPHPFPSSPPGLESRRDHVSYQKRMIVSHVAGRGSILMPTILKSVRKLANEVDLEKKGGEGSQV